MHQEQHLHGGSQFISDVVIGMSDGLTVPFALAAGVSSAVTNNSIVITAGVAEIIAGCISMGLGGYLAGKTAIDFYASELKREYLEVEQVPEQEKQEIRNIFAAYGLSEGVQQQIADELSQDKDKWVAFMMQYELGLQEPDQRQAAKSGLTIGLSYALGGLIPLLPYFCTSLPLEGFKYSSVVTLICLFIFGYYRSKMTGQPLLKGALKVMFIGALAASAAFLVAKWLG
ncbi:VIT1/CCC1 transporter family protein [Chitinophaga vietnamensis]|uniref:VIT1/CCC1 transporter family protein n=1 Tax=Chitinophaga vietnamensis TaxID=2593957 RepID=UPI0011777DDA|nr:VIT1/CCC1 transporter family protein [Chitinophaga vietnamensis]